MANKEPSLSISSFHQCTSLIFIKLNPSNFLLWKSQVFPLVRSLGLMHHLVGVGKPEAEMEDDDGKRVPNPKYETCVNNDGLLNSWLLGIMSEQVLWMMVGAE